MVIVIIGVLSTVMAIFLGNVIFAAEKHVPLPITGFDFMWGMVGLAVVTYLSLMIKTKAK